MKYLVSIICLSVAITFSSCTDENTTTSSEFYVPAEWAKQESVWMGWATYNNKADWSNEALQAEMIKVMVPSVKIDLCVQDAANESYVRSYLLSHGVTNEQIETGIRFHHITFSDVWFRDWSGVWKINNTGQRELVVMGFNGWGYDEYWGVGLGENTDDLIDESIALAMNAPTRRLNLITEPGNLEFNGEGTLIAVKESLMQRNPGLTINQIEAELKSTFNLKKVIFLPHSVGTDGHTVRSTPYSFDVSGDGIIDNVYGFGVEHSDEFVRWISPTKVFLAEAPSEEQANANPIYARTREAILQAREILQNTTTGNGENITVIDFPEPGNIIWEVTPEDDIHWIIGELNFELEGKENVDTTKPFYMVLAASYANFLITNDAIIIAKYADIDPSFEGKDAEARRLVEQHFPGRTVFQLDPRAINIGGGGIHCITNQMPLSDQ